jgi:hypothetical protein
LVHDKALNLNIFQILAQIKKPAQAKPENVSGFMQVGVHFEAEYAVIE